MNSFAANIVFRAQADALNILYPDCMKLKKFQIIQGVALRAA